MKDKTETPIIETRIVDAVEENGKRDLRIERAENKPPQLVGYAIRFNSLSKDLGGFRERVLPGALDKVLADGVDVRALVNHDTGQLLGRTSAGTLRIGKDERGLWFQIDMPDTQYARDIQTLVDRGDVRGMSFGFRVPANGDRFIRDGAEVIRELTSVDLKEITVTSIPAYPDTSLHLRIDPTIAARIPAAAPTAPPATPASNLRRRRLGIV